MTEFRPAPEVERIAERLIDRVHGHLAGQRIEYVFRDKASVSAGKTVWGKARLLSNLNAFLATPEGQDPSVFVEPEKFFVIEIADDVWRMLDAGQREALVDHELSHCTLTEDDEAPVLRAHDVEDFAGVIRRHGMWQPEVEALVKAAIDHGHPSLFDENDDEDGAE